MLRRPVLPAVLLCSLLAAPAAQAGLFDDSEARQQIADLKAQSEQRFDTQAKAQMELATQIMGLREEISRLRGQNEALIYENEQMKKRQQDLYLDLDSRLRNLEPSPPAAAPGSTPGTSEAGHEAAPAARPADPAGESKAYEAALNLFKAAKYKEAAQAFEAFVSAHPDSDLAPSAQFWLGNAWYAQKDCKKAIDAQLLVTTRWPDSARAPDAMLAIANCQRDWGNTQAARRTLSNVIAKYPDSQAASQARQRLGQK
ncbi:MAG: tol-pal system protein YbgF [Azovibrio sp.]|uniref:tol-pal system protein YbgF n=1 Tax=Azovibrio sp. TaxID=1872673 RepID=UPI003C77611A